MTATRDSLAAPDGHQETIDFDYCIIAAGCNFGPFHKLGDPEAKLTSWADSRLQMGMGQC